MTRHPRRRAKHTRKGTATPSSTSSKRKTGLSPEAWERIGKLAVAFVEVVSKLIDAISRLH